MKSVLGAFLLCSLLSATAHAHSSASHSHSSSASQSKRLALQADLGPTDKQLEDGRYYDVYTFTGKAGQTLKVSLSSSDKNLSPDLIVINSNGRQLRGSSSTSSYTTFNKATQKRVFSVKKTLSLKLPDDGAYTIQAISRASGQYTIAATLNDAEVVLQSGVAKPSEPSQASPGKPTPSKPAPPKPTSSKPAPESPTRPKGTGKVASGDRFNIKFDYRYASNEFSAQEKATIEAAGKVWSSFISQGFPDIPKGAATYAHPTEQEIACPYSNESGRVPNDKCPVPLRKMFKTVKYDDKIDDIVIFVRAKEGVATANAKPGSRRNLEEWRPDTEKFQPHLGWITFGKNKKKGRVNLSLTIHEIGHALGIIGWVSQHKKNVSGDLLTGPNARAVNGGKPIRLKAANDTGHFDRDSKVPGSGATPVVADGAGNGLPTLFDLAALADIGYTIPVLSSKNGKPATYLNYKIEGTDGDDSYSGQDGSDTLFGGPGNDRLMGQYWELDSNMDRGDRLFGGPGNDIISGVGGDDLIVGGPGNDELYGDLDKYRPNQPKITGRDTFAFDVGSGQDEIWYFNTDHDKIRVTPAYNLSAKAILNSAVTVPPKKVLCRGQSDGETPRCSTVLFKNGTRYKKSKLTLNSGNSIVIVHDKDLTMENIEIGPIE